MTAARNEAAFLPGLLESVYSQTVRPTRWVIVSDSSTDDTNALVAEAGKAHRFIQQVSTKGEAKRTFRSKALAFLAGYDALRAAGYQFIGNLDADVTFEPDYYERLMVEMVRNPRLGVASGVCWDKTSTGFRCVTISHNHAVGAVQFFRRECFETIGGYRPVSVGGLDSLAERMARMRGWETRAFSDLKVYHHKPVDSATARTAVRKAYRAGLTEYHIGTTPLFAVAKAVRRWRDHPTAASVVIRLLGYFVSCFRQVKRDAPPELVAYLKSEQRAALKGWILEARGRRLGPR